MDNPAYIIHCENEFATPKSGKRTEAIVKAHTFEEAITLTGVGRFHYKLLLVCGLCFMSVMVEIMGVSLIMQPIKCDLLPTLTEQGTLASAGFLGVVLSSHAMGFLADTWGRVKTLRFALAFSAFFSACSSFSLNIWMLIVLRFLTGFFISGGQACVFSLCGEFHGNATRVRHVTLLSGFMCIAMMFAPSMAIVILPLELDWHIFGLYFAPWRLLLLTNLSVSLLALVGLYTLPETPKYQLVQGDADSALTTLRAIYAQNTAKAPELFAVHAIVLETGGTSLSSVHGFRDAIKLIWQQTVPLFYRERVLHTINICFIQFTVYAIAQGVFMWLPTILNQMVTTASNQQLCTILSGMGDMNSANNATQTDIVCNGEVDNFTYLVLITIGGAFTVIYLIFAFTIDLIGKKNLMIGWMVLSMASLILLNWIDDFVLVVIALTIVMAVGNCGGLVSTIAMEFYPTHVNAMGMCFIMMIGRLGAVVGSNFLGSLLFRHCSTILWLFLAVIILLSVLGMFLPEKKRA